MSQSIRQSTSKNSKDRKQSITGSIGGSKRKSKRHELASQVLSDPSQSRNNMLKIGNGGIASNKPLAVVFDEDGHDVTPIPLVSPNVFSRGGRHTAAENGGDRASVQETLSNLESMAFGSQMGSVYASQSQGGGFSNSSKASGSKGSVSEEVNDDVDNVSINSSVNSEDEGELKRADTAKDGAKHLPRAVQAKLPPTDAELERLVHLTLAETSTICLLSIPSMCASNDSFEEVVVIKAANAKYRDAKATRQNNDNLVDKPVQTLNFQPKNKDIQATGTKFANAETMANQWSIYDDYAILEIEADAEETVELKDLALGDQAVVALSNEIAFGGSKIDRSHSTIEDSSVQADEMSVTGQSVAGGDGGSVYESGIISDGGTGKSGQHFEGDKSVDREMIFRSFNQDNMKESLLLVERAIVENNYKTKILAYRDVKAMMETALTSETTSKTKPKNQEQTNDNSDDSDYDEDDISVDGERAPEEKRPMDQFAVSIPSMQYLWSFRCELTRGRVVTHMAWNKSKEDIISIAYGDSKTNLAATQGLILCWSLKNPEWPERIYKAHSPVTAIDFSHSNPNQLAVGFKDGRIAIYDVRKKSNAPVLDNSGMPGKHHESVWELKWVERERVHGDEQSKGENLVSISTDGRVTQWIIRKDLMTLKRVNKQEVKAVVKDSAKTGAFISSLAGGLCFDFNPNDSNQYIVGTDDGHIHRCSCSLYEQYLATHYGHTSPVYRLRWSPFLSGAFLSCSADWTVRLWHQDYEAAVFKFQSGKDTIADIAWSPSSSTVFGCVSSDGRMEIWDLSFSVLDPAILHTVLDRQLTCIIFAANSPVVLVGDDNGAVNVYKVQQLPSHQGRQVDEEGKALNDILEQNMASSAAISGQTHQAATGA